MPSSVTFIRPGSATEPRHVTHRDVADRNLVDGDGREPGDTIGGLGAACEVAIRQVDAGALRVFIGQGNHGRAGIDQHVDRAAVEFGLGVVMTVAAGWQFDNIAIPRARRGRLTRACCALISRLRFDGPGSCLGLGRPGFRFLYTTVGIAQADSALRWLLVAVRRRFDAHERIESKTDFVVVDDAADKDDGGEQPACPLAEGITHTR